MKSPEISRKHCPNKIVIIRSGATPTQHFVYYRHGGLESAAIWHLRRDGVWCQVGNQSVGEFFFDDYDHAERFALNNPNFGPWHPKFQELALPPGDATDD